MEETNEITLQELFMILWDKVIIIMVTTLVGGLLAFSISNWVISPEYTSRISMYVHNTQSHETTIANINDINASQKLVATYIEILKSDKVLQEVIEATGVHYTPNQIRQMMSANAVNGTELFEINITSTNAQEAATIANTIAELAPDEIIRVVKAGSVALVDTAYPATTPSSPNILLNTVIGVMLGGVLSVLAVLVHAMLDTRIKSEDDLKKQFEIPVLGQVPDLENNHIQVK